MAANVSKTFTSTKATATLVMKDGDGLKMCEPFNVEIPASIGTDEQALTEFVRVTYGAVMCQLSNIHDGDGQTYTMPLDTFILYAECGERRLGEFVNRTISNGVSFSAVKLDTIALNSDGTVNGSWATYTCEENGVKAFCKENGLLCVPETVEPLEPKTYSMSWADFLTHATLKEAKPRA